MSLPAYIILEETPRHILIRDTGHHTGVSVTNAAELVVDSLLHELRGRRLLYFDSEDDLGELKVSPQGEFLGFGPAVMDS